MTRSGRIYLDYNATTPCAPEVLETMLPYFEGEFANPASPHAMGRAAAVAVAQAREQVAELAGCDAQQIFFTSGATESNNIALLGVAAMSLTRKKIVTSAVEHKSVLAPCEHLAELGFEVVRLPVDRDGVVDINAAKVIIDGDTLLVSIQAANNETGTIQPVEALADLARACGALMHSDCAQMLGKLPLSAMALGAHYASFSAHKMYGPKGAGALFVRDHESRSLVSPLWFGGGQEDGLRPGTQNVPSIVGLGEASRLARVGLAEEASRLAELRDSLERQIRARIPSVSVNGAVGSRLPGTTSLTFPSIPADLLISRCTEVCFSSGAACTSSALSPSHVLLAMGRSAEAAACTARLSVGRYTTRENVDLSAQELANAVAYLGERLGNS